MKTLVGVLLGAGVGAGIAALLLRQKAAPRKVVVYSKGTAIGFVEGELTKAGIQVERMPLKYPDGSALIVSEVDVDRALALIAELDKTGKIKKAEMGHVNIISPANRVGFSEKFIENLHYS